VATQTGSGHGASVQAWLACLVILAGFIIGGIALIYWNWAVFWVGVGVAVVGVVYARLINIMEEVTEYGGGGSDPSTQATG
jgi:fatty acid desaturase